MREYPFVLNATGRRPNTAGLCLETLGITLDAVGAVPVDARLHTTAAGVYAIGDVTNNWNLTRSPSPKACAGRFAGRPDAARGRP
jgi:glutathione reductase (NADPH)